MLMTEWKLEDAIAIEREEGFEEGIEKGREEGREEGLEKGRKEGLEKGIERGEEKARKEIVRAMLQSMSIDEVARILKTTIEDIKKIIDNE